MSAAAPARSRATIAVILIAVVATGLSIRYIGPRFDLSFLIWKYAGSLLWATMVYFLVAASRPASPSAQIAMLAMGVAVAVELFRLVRTPELDAFRLTTAGALLLGRVFSLWNIVAYAAGIAFGVLIDAASNRPRLTSS